MTTIIAAKTSDGIVFGFDSRISIGYEIQEELSQTKVVVNSGLIMGFSGESRAAQLMGCVSLPNYYEYEGTDTEHSYLVTVVIPKFRELLKQEQAVTYENGRLNTNILAIICLNNKLFMVDGSLGVLEPSRKFVSIGSGSDYALGALTAGASVLEALEIAADFDMKTGGKLIVKSAEELLNEFTERRK